MLLNYSPLLKGKVVFSIAALGVGLLHLVGVGWIDVRANIPRHSNTGGMIG